MTVTSKIANENQQKKYTVEDLPLVEAPRNHHDNPYHNQVRLVEITTAKQTNYNKTTLKFLTNLVKVKDSL